jgi:hypothetical protein
MSSIFVDCLEEHHWISKWILADEFDPNVINPLPAQFKSLLPGQQGCVFFSGHLNVRKYQYVLVRLGWQAAF